MTRPYLDREAILAHEDRPTTDLQVPEWGDQWVRLGTWTLAQQWRISQASQDVAARGHLLALVVVLSIVDAKGARLFGDDDIPRLSDEKNYRALNRIAQAAMAWNGLDAQSVDDLGKESATSPNDGSPSGSPRASA